MTIPLGDYLAQRISELLNHLDERDAQVLLAHIVQHPRSWLIAHPETLLTPAQLDSANAAFAKLQAGNPLPYILGHWEFFGLDFIVTPDVLIPRPETELLVETAIAWLKKKDERRKIIDVGTGSGCIPIAIAKSRELEISAVDISSAALEIAKQNAMKHGLDKQITFIENDLLLPSTVHRPLSYDLITANLPYVPTETVKGLKISKHEPWVALDGGTDGFVLIRRLLEQAQTQLASGGLILLEIESSLGNEGLAIAREHFPAAQVALKKDLAGLDRLIVIQT